MYGDCSQKTLQDTTDPDIYWYPVLTRLGIYETQELSIEKVYGVVQSMEYCKRLLTGMRLILRPISFRIRST